MINYVALPLSRLQLGQALPVDALDHGYTNVIRKYLQISSDAAAG